MVVHVIQFIILNKKFPNKKILVFTEAKDTMEYLEKKIRSWGYSVNTIHGDEEALPVRNRRQILEKYLNIAMYLEPIIKITHVSIWKWVQKYSILADRFLIGNRKVQKIFVDETLLKIDGQDYWLWLAYELIISFIVIFLLLLQPLSFLLADLARA